LVKYKYTEAKKLPVIMLLRWVDAQTTGGDGWMDKTEMRTAAKAKLPVMNSIGYIIYEDAFQYAIVSTLGPNESSQVTKIPKCMILSAVEYGPR
jgi:hypothetical protein